MGNAHFYFNLPGQRGLPERELMLLDKAGYPIDLRRVTMDRVNCSVQACERPGLRRLLLRLRAPDDMLVVCELAGLGCSARDVLATLDRCRAAGIGVRCLQIGDIDLASADEPGAVRILRAAVELETAARRDRTLHSVAQVRADGRVPGRPPFLSDAERKRVLRSLANGHSVSEVARRFGTSRQTVLRIRERAAKNQPG